MQSGVTVADDQGEVRYSFNGASALHWAAYHGRLSALKLLLGHGANVIQQDEVRLEREYNAPVFLGQSEAVMVAKSLRILCVRREEQMLCTQRHIVRIPPPVSRSSPVFLSRRNELQRRGHMTDSSRFTTLLQPAPLRRR